MSWLDKVEYEYKYKCENGHTTIIEQHECDKEPKSCLAPGCDLIAEYAGFKPLKMQILGKVAFDQNGRKAFRIHHQDGTVRHVSQSKMNYIETGDLKPAYTKAYEEHLVATGSSDQLQGQTREEMLSSRKKTEEFRKNLKPVTSFDE